MFDKRAAIVASEMGAEPHPVCSEIYLKRFPARPEQDIRKLNYIHGSSMYRRAAYQQTGGYVKETLPEDASLFARMLDAGWRAELVDEFLLEYRQHSKDQANIIKTLELQNAHYVMQIRRLEEQLAEAQAYFEKFNITSNLLKQIVLNRSWRLFTYLSRLYDKILPADSFQSVFLEKLTAFLYKPIQINMENRLIKLIQDSGYFDPDWYVSQYPDVIHTGMEPARHYLLLGGFEGLSPGKDFSSKEYMELYPDVWILRMNPLVHFLLHGKQEGRKAAPHRNHANKRF
ncbi:MAG: hypothetical protein HXY38_09380 [Chloroflexi bacterium]|nr:hypothetical protein [Chloroflexota bacterium]